MAGSYSDAGRPSERGDDPGFTWAGLRERRQDRPVSELPRLTGDAVRLVWRAARPELVVVMSLTVLVAALTALQLLLTREVLASFFEVDGGAASHEVIAPLAAFLVVWTVLSVVSLVLGERRRVMSELVARYAQQLIASAAVTADLVDFERPRFHNQLQRSLAHASSKPIQVTFALLGVASAFATIAGVSVALAFAEPVLLLLVVVAFGPMWMVSRALSRIAYGFDLEQTEDDRRRSYLLSLLTHKRPAKEVRAYGLDRFFADQHAALWASRIERLREITRRRIRLGTLARVVNGLMFGAVVVLLAWFIETGRTSLADAAVAAGALLILGQRLGAAAGGMGQLYESSLFLSDVHEFLDESDARVAARGLGNPAPPLEQIAADDIWFRYPAAEHSALSGVSLTVRRGEVVALVGANGSGKTTLAKTLASLYEPDRGMLRWNGAAASDLSLESRRDQVAVIFQDFENYLFTAGENIGLGRVADFHDEEAIEAAARRAGASEFVESLREGYGTLLGPEFFTGTDLSVGQWQRMAIARAFFRDARLVILDEPSSALDPTAEADLFERLRELCADRAVVVISHRFSTVKGADRIHVLEQGRITETGSHAELLALGGTYAEMFRLQAKNYTDD